MCKYTQITHTLRFQTSGSSFTAVIRRHYNGCHTYSVCIVVEDHQVAVAHVKAGQMVAGVLGIKYVLIDNISGPPCFRRVPSGKQWDVSNANGHKTNIRHKQRATLGFSGHDDDGYSRSDLTNWSIFAENVIHFLSRDLIRKVSDVQDSIYLWG